jgi:hypothetical protein
LAIGFVGTDSSKVQTIRGERCRFICFDQMVQVTLAHPSRPSPAIRRGAKGAILKEGELQPRA